MFRVGQKVVCVNDERGFLGIKAGRFDYAIKKGDIYTVRWIGEFNTYGVDYIGVRLRGVVRDDSMDTPFHSDRFRPIVERKTDISIFTKMLTPNKRRVQERA